MGPKTNLVILSSFSFLPIDHPTSSEIHAHRYKNSNKKSKIFRSTPTKPEKTSTCPEVAAGPEPARKKAPATLFFPGNSVQCLRYCVGLKLFSSTLAATSLINPTLK